MNTVMIDNENPSVVWQQIYDKALLHIQSEKDIKREQAISNARSVVRYLVITLSASVITTMLILIVAFITLKTDAITLAQSQQVVELVFWVMLTLSAGVGTVFNVGHFENVAKSRAAQFATTMLEKRDQMNDIDIVIETRQELDAKRAYRNHGAPSYKHTAG